MVVVSARIDDPDAAVLRRAGVNLSQLFRLAARQEARRIERVQALGLLRKVAVPVQTGAQDLVRADRDAH